MTKEQAIQEQIDEIMDSFDFDTAAKAMEVYKEEGHGYPADWFDMEVFSTYQMRQDARRILRLAADHAPKEGTIVTRGSYFHAEATCGNDEKEGPWISLGLFFGDQFSEEGTCYEEA